MAQTEQEAAKSGVSSVVRYWTNEINASRKREKEYRKEGERIREIYSGTKKKTIPFNILYSNTETMAPALYSSTPKPVVQRRFKDADPTARAAAMAGQRVLEFLIDTNIEEYETFDQSMRDTVLDALLPGRGLARAKYEAEVTPIPTGEMDAEGKPITEEKKTSEFVCTEQCSWNRVFFGYYRKWAKCPWIAFEHYMDKDEATEKFGEEVASKMIFTVTDDEERADGEKKKKADVDEGSEKRTCLVYEIWKRKGREVCFIAPTYTDGYLKKEDDPLELTGFFPMPRPLQVLIKTDDPTPTALYTLYENQATELNKISTRINRIVDAMKVRGAYDGSLGDTLRDLMSTDDNTLLPTANASSISLEGGLEKYIWFMPLDKLVLVLRELIMARNECKQIIYEVTGLSDIIRGASNASETATAQSIKNQWGSLRIKMLQNEVRRYVREMLRIMLEIAAKKFSPETFAQMTGLPFTTQAQKQQAQQLLQAAAQQPPQPGPNGQPAPQDPAIARAQQVMQTPDWEAVLALLQNDLARAYRIDIETDSTVQVNEQEDKQNINEAMSAMGEFLKGVTPLVQQGIMPFDAAKSMLLAIVRRFRFGTEVEEEIKSMQPPQPKSNPDEAAAKIKAESDAQTMQREQQMAAQKAQLDQEQMTREAQYQREEHQMKMAELKAKGEYNAMMANLKVMQLRAKVAAEERAAATRAAEAAAKPKEDAGASA